jgi:hypothetical protein
MKMRRFPYLSASIAMIALALFAFSLFAEFHFAATRWSGMEGVWFVHVQRGRIIASRTNLASSNISRPAKPSWRNAGGFSWERRTFSGGGGVVGGKLMSQHLAVPIYPLPLAAGAVLAWRIRRGPRTRTPGCCAKCGYDLRASPERCPECGASNGAR